MKKVIAERRRDIDFTHATRGAVVKPSPGKTKISIRLDNEILDYFRSLVDEAGGGNYQSFINDALRAYIDQAADVNVTRSLMEDVKQRLAELQQSIQQQQTQQLKELQDMVQRSVREQQRLIVEVQDGTLARAIKEALQRE